MAHQRPEAVIRLVRRLDAPDHGFFIHYDARRSNLDFQRLADEFAGQPNVRFLKRHKCRWGDAGILHGMIEGIHELARMNFAYDYAIHISGQDYPIKSNAKIRQHLATAAGASFMEATAWPIPNWEKGRAIKRIENFHVHLPVPPWARSLGWQPMWQHLAIPMKRKIPGGLHPHFGSAFWYFHRSCQQQIHEYVTQHPDFLRFFEHVLLPDECFFQTLLMNSNLASTVVCRTLTYVEWRPPWPGVMTLADLPKLHQSECLFARKFAPDIDRQVLDQLDLLNSAG
jgi:Core-2/I-Branching enzyme